MKAAIVFDSTEKAAGFIKGGTRPVALRTMM